MLLCMPVIMRNIDRIDGSDSRNLSDMVVVLFQLINFVMWSWYMIANYDWSCYIWGVSTVKASLQENSFELSQNHSICANNASWHPFSSYFWRIDLHLQGHLILKLRNLRNRVSQLQFGFRPSCLQYGRRQYSIERTPAGMPVCVLYSKLAQSTFSQLHLTAIFYTPRFSKVERGVCWFHVIRLSVDKIVSALYLPQY